MAAKHQVTVNAMKKAHRKAISEGMKRAWRRRARAAKIALKKNGARK